MAMTPEQLVRTRRRLSYNRGTWREQAACRHADTDLFFTVGTSKRSLAMLERAKAVCDACDVGPECLAFAMSTHQEYGVWGGLDEDERAALYRSWRRSKVG